ncbi:LytTR family transcriptional regulator DNA-binding domain-containing protein [Zeaxanthinibacter sp. PT1]|uniref:LytTR family transcriptional regulator DNA-binding domain-containing protein n=1 Tax=Zeaxanthinibacter TaxID=561554 RepID=UPI0023497013|nr:LytTR family transcriptional regulator DNA-binding domain-containing protein [Zeaxanthinibacter sp. PT1]MDC6352254.1 LytTR family transcriptional regulator DNA-binding domain-containing protein [Zeaxanthinibacter sp. PT1]
MKEKTRVLIVEDDMIIAANISLQLSRLGYEITGIESRGEEAVIHARRNTPDIILMDIHLKGELDGIETTKMIQEEQDIPIIYLTANNDELTFNRARATHPQAFVSKPFGKLNLERTVALVAEQLKDRKLPDHIITGGLRFLEDRIFIRHHGRMVKIMLEDILYIEAERNYSNIITDNGRFLVVSTLKTIERELPSSYFLRVHRSYVVNISKLDVLAEGHLEISRKVIPVSRSYRESLVGRLHTI